MVANRQRAQSFLSRIKEKFSPVAVKERHGAKAQKPLPPTVRPTKTPSETSLGSYWKLLMEQCSLQEKDRALLADPATLETMAVYENNIENFIGTLKMPLGLAGPLRINGLYAQGDFYVPLATTEATLVASYARGSKLISAAGGCTTAMLNDGLPRAPVFEFTSLTEAGFFVAWIMENFERLCEEAQSTTRFGKLMDIKPHVEGNRVYLTCEYLTGDAAGQNMTTIATQKLCSYILQHMPVKPVIWFLESNFSGDKKASNLSFVTVRGKKVTAEVCLPAELIEQYLHTSAERLFHFWRISVLGSAMSGTMGAQGHFANGLAALYLATGQDVACVAESSVGVTRMELRDGQLYVAVTLPNIMVGTVGGGTGLPSQNVGLRMLGLAGAGHAPALAEVCAALCLAGELSLIGAICAEEFAAAHQKFARGAK